MSTKRHKTVLRTVRLTQEMDSLLRDDAGAKDMTVNGLINRILTKYVEWDTHIEKFRFVSIAGETFKDLLEECCDGKIEQIATDTGSRVPQAITLFWFKKLNLETLLKTISAYGKYSGLATTEVKVDEGNYTITFHHDLGDKWSLFVKNFTSQFIKTTLGIVPHTQISDNVVLVSFYAPASNEKRTLSGKQR